MFDHRNPVPACDPLGIGQRLVTRSVQPTMITRDDKPGLIFFAFDAD
jgi:hypothetical protein